MPTDEVVQAAETISSGIDISLIISIIALVVSALSPILSSIISGKYQIRVTKMETEAELKRKQLELNAEAKRRYHEFYEQHRAEVIERYINSVGRAIQHFAVGNRQEFGESMGEIYMYVDESLWPLLDTIAKKLDKNNPRDPSAELRELCQKLSYNGVRAKNEEQPDSPKKQ